MCTRSMKKLLFLSTILTITRAKTFDKCELARIFKRAGLDGFEGYSLQNWVCTAFYESAYNSAALNIEWHQGKILSMDCGIFQINRFWWCLDNDTPVTLRNCGMSCSAFLDDDLTDDIICAKNIVKLHPGMSAWATWNSKCNRKGIDHFVAGCNI
ncbi:lysozyme C-1-like [Chiloscyllium punctatum]|uniref:lysozyme C-1-like n=1 Tax=Chiloscyllium punctatum TaxID=137246 RepID=UPI003B63A80E